MTNTYLDSNGYLRNKRSGRLVHREIAFSYLYPHNHNLDFSDLQIHHKDGNKLNNNLDNLQLVTPKEHEKIHNITPELKEKWEKEKQLKLQKEEEERIKQEAINDRMAYAREAREKKRVKRFQKEETEFMKREAIKGKMAFARQVKKEKRIERQKQMERSAQNEIERQHVNTDFQPLIGFLWLIAASLSLLVFNAIILGFQITFNNWISIFIGLLVLRWIFKGKK
jgi:cation transport ATPase